MAFYILTMASIQLGFPSEPDPKMAAAARSRLISGKGLRSFPRAIAMFCTDTGSRRSPRFTRYRRIASRTLASNRDNPLEEPTLPGEGDVVEEFFAVSISALLLTRECVHPGMTFLTEVSSQEVMNLDTVPATQFESAYTGIVRSNNAIRLAAAHAGLPVG
jgi:hypothetical protein